MEDHYLFSKIYSFIGNEVTGAERGNAISAEQTASRFITSRGR